MNVTARNVRDYFSNPTHALVVDRINQMINQKTVELRSHLAKGKVGLAQSQNNEVEGYGKVLIMFKDLQQELERRARDSDKGNA